MIKKSNDVCYNCFSTKASFYAEENGFSLIQCKDCGLVYLRNLPDDNEITEEHRQGKHKGLREVDVTGVFHISKVSMYLKVLKDLYGSSIQGMQSWLDVGCGHGEFILALQKFSAGSISVLGTEPNIHKQESARSKGLNVDYFDLRSHDKKYDGISLLNVYSHLPNPPSFIENIKDRLNPGGELVIETGDTANLKAKEHYKPFYLPDHVSFASEEIVVNILERHGFQIMNIKKYPFPNLTRPDFSPIRVLKEGVKLVLPNRQSTFFDYPRFFYYKSKYSKTDMYVRAKLKN